MDLPSENIFVWNERGLNSAVCRNVVRDAVSSEQATLICLSETKLSIITERIIMQMLGVDFDYVYLRAAQTRGGILVAWRRDVWSALQRWTFALTPSQLVFSQLQPPPLGA